jgi:anti-sigma-K factor RskA
VSDEHPVEDLAAYALGSVDAVDNARIEAHVVDCAACAARLRDYEFVVSALPYGLVPVPPPPEAWTTISASAQIQTSRKSRRRSRSRLPAWLRVARWPALAALLALLVIWNVTLERELTRRSPGPAPGPEVEALSRRPGRVIILGGTGAPNASARIFVAVDGGGHLAVSGLPPLQRERTYQLWFVRTGRPAVSAATFRVDSSGRAWVKVEPSVSLDDVRMIMVTEEPASGSPTPTGGDLLIARPWP